MKELINQEAQKMIEKGKEDIKQIIAKGGKTIKTIIEEKDKITTIMKIEPVNGKSTSSKTVISKDEISIGCL